MQQSAAKASNVTYQPVQPGDVYWLEHFLDEETLSTKSAEEEEGIECDELVDTIKVSTKVLVGDVPAQIPVALFGIKDGFAWMMTTRFLRDYGLHRTLLGAMRDVLGKHIREKGRLRGYVRTTSGATRMLAMLGATFTLPVDVRSGKLRSKKFLLWDLQDNLKLQEAA